MACFVEADVEVAEAADAEISEAAEAEIARRLYDIALNSSGIESFARMETVRRAQASRQILALASAWGALDG